LIDFYFLVTSFLLSLIHSVKAVDSLCSIFFCFISIFCDEINWGSYWVKYF